MVDFAKLTVEARLTREQEVFVGYCKFCDIVGKIYESNIVRLDNTNDDKDLFKCPRCKAFQERHEMIPF